MTSLIADSITSGNLWAADLLFLIAAILFAVEAVLVVVGRAATGVLVPAALALVAFGLFLT